MLDPLHQKWRDYRDVERNEKTVFFPFFRELSKNSDYNEIIRKPHSCNHQIIVLRLVYTTKKCNKEKKNTLTTTCNT
jgi:hypothetical protein